MSPLPLLPVILAGMMLPIFAQSPEAAKSDLFPQVKTILSQRCAACHNEKAMLLNGGNLSVETLAALLKGGNQGVALVPGTPDKSSLFIRMGLDESNPLAMPPSKRFVRVPAAEQTVIKAWIEAGAKWPDGEKITYQKATPKAGEIDSKELALVKKIRARILEKSKDDSDLVAYTDRLEGVRVPLKMLPVPAGQFLMKGTVPGDEFTAQLDAFWMAEKEIPWDLYSPFMEPKQVRDKDGLPQDPSAVPKDATILAQPSQPYHPMSFGMGVRRHPAIAMTHHAANKYCQWLSWQTGHFYRLPTEAEWEYAARAGVTTDYPWGDKADPAAASSLAWFNGNSNGSYQRLGKKSANAWGFHDMLGNVMEWTLDGYVENRRQSLGGKDIVKNPWVKATQPYPHVCKGGHWNADASALSYNGRTPSDPKWKASDPQSPRSIWYHTSIMWIGFRPVRPKELPTAEEMYAYWNSGVAYD